ncbi:glutathione peroxidase [Fulvivirga sediminis]|uniref:Glutathione peroxidase n=1 Tax=Fulvivirga sediminis TaxID=2803949 RepID=A0A937F760_9BACT|nr:glutathione peroxidase [Fulvivirga sediminis]MBL3656266.1 glutathione peroxidase [Fulvivirga sediminis]
MEFYDLKAETPQGKEIPMSDFRDKAVLVVNTATQCGLTPQFEGLEKLHQTYGKKGLVVLGFPCNQFLSQEPLGNDEMEEACKINHGVTFQLTKKVDVNGSNTHPVFKYLKDTLGGTLGKKIKWNFTKFLITPEGKPFKRYAPTTKPEKIEDDIKQVLKA